ncbi:MAG: sugar phosphate nucleotidyltransferase [Pseudomonadota bacterium]
MTAEPILPVVVLAGGQATRLRPITETIPKCLVEVQGVPFIDIQLRQLAGQGVRRVFLLVGYLGEMVRQHVGTGERYGLSVTVVQDGPKLLGTAGSIKAARSLLPPMFFVLYGDSYLRCSYADVQRAFEAGARPVLMTVFRNDKQWDTSNVIFADGRVVRYSKRNLSPDMRHIDYGLMVFSRDVFDTVPDGEPYDLAAVLEEQVSRGNVTGFEVNERFYEIGSHSGLKDLGEFFESSAIRSSAS